ncbi:MAG: hypothetical protein IT261_04740 [Saprospiraceae bacterium]|nr:hypothetical protein [Saprospiraceae bacterium]
MSKASLLWQKIACIASCLAAFSSQAQVVLSADSTRVETGNALTLYLRYPSQLGKPSDSLTFGAWSEVLPTENIIEQSEWTASNDAFYGKSLTVLFFDEDTLHLPPLSVGLRNGKQLLTNELELIVTATPSPDDLNDMAPIKDIHREPADWTDYLPWILGVLAVLALLGLVYYLVSRQQKARVLSRSMALPPHELALKKLEALKGKNLIAAGQIKEHYAALTDILREYLEKRFEVPALESTTPETMLALGNSSFPDTLLAPLQQLLEQADLAKFARIVPEPAFHDESFMLAQQLILETQALAHPDHPESTES